MLIRQLGFQQFRDSGDARNNSFYHHYLLGLDFSKISTIAFSDLREYLDVVVYQPSLCEYLVVREMEQRDRQSSWAAELLKEPGIQTLLAYK